jgi:hypothetical protein
MQYCLGLELTLLSLPIRFVSQKSEENLKLHSNKSNEEIKGLNEPDHDEDKLKEEQEEETGAMTINRVF